MNEPWKHYTELNKPVTKATLYDSTYIGNVQNGNSIKTENQRVAARD